MTSAVTVMPTALPIRVLVVDDSLVIRGLIARFLKEAPGIEVVGSVPDGAAAIERVQRGNVDVVILDIEMPGMDGLTALPKILSVRPAPAVIMASTLTTRNADVSLQALKLGATDYVPKPTTTTAIYGTAEFRTELLEKVTALGKKQLRALGKTWNGSNAAPGASKPVQTRTAGSVKPKLIAVGSSTGGPKALTLLLQKLRPSINLPVIITQHMPPTFTTILAEHLGRDTGWPVAEGKSGDVLKPGHVYLAPGDFHMKIASKVAGPTIELDQGPKESFCRPAVDVMFRSAIQVYGGAVLAVILTGMGADGLKGSDLLVKAGGTVLAQDEASSVVWGMPGAVATAGLCAEVAPIETLVRHCEKLAGGMPR